MKHASFSRKSLDDGDISPHQLRAVGPERLKYVSKRIENLTDVSLWVLNPFNDELAFIEQGRVKAN